MSERRTRIGMIVVGLVIWLVAIAWPRLVAAGLLLGVDDGRRGPRSA